MKKWIVFAGLLSTSLLFANSASGATVYDRCYAVRKARVGPVVAAFDCWRPRPVVYRPGRPTEWDICVRRNERIGMNPVSAAFACTGKKMWR